MAARRPWVAFTNGTAHTPAHCAGLLRHTSFALQDTQMLTPSVSAGAALFTASHVPCLATATGRDSLVVGLAELATPLD